MAYYRTASVDAIAPNISSFRLTKMLEWADDTDADDYVRITSSYGSDTVRYLSADYERTQRKAFNSQGDCMAAWEGLDFPTHNVTREDGSVAAELYSSQNFRAYQFASGHGKVVHYSTLAAIRTHNGLVINNAQDYGAGFATVTRARDSDASLPLSSLVGSDVWPADKTMYDITRVRRSTRLDGRKHSVSNTYPRLIEFGDGSALVLARDNSAKEHNQQTCAFRISADERADLRTVADAEDLLVPEDVRVAQARGGEIVDTGEMVPSRDDSRHDDAGDVIQRQGEWFFVPTGREAVPDGGTVKTNSPTQRGDHATMGSHVPTKEVSPLPRECDECGASRFEWDDDGITCKECGNSFHSSLVRGTVRHVGGEHYMARLGTEWHRAVRHDRDVMVVDTSADRGGRRRNRRERTRWD